MRIPLAAKARLAIRRPTGTPGGCASSARMVHGRPVSIAVLDQSCKLRSNVFTLFPLRLSPRRPYALLNITLMKHSRLSDNPQSAVAGAERSKPAP